ncbi:hypothetical protein OE88DRAFT_1669220 [Heliocybe sulcata]|uniref:Fungal-type protein kinase domain-containing protein n=1 Tax=Heliocybe sulcata TaxID=5364 RepID=A0A5C3MVL7_9AGAM|nr:hypothetical protein OE88DRAFT_1669220 [Heliocybe sulcata]
MASSTSSMPDSTTKEAHPPSPEDAARLKRDRHDKRGMARIITSSTSTPFFTLHLKTIHPPELLEEDFPLNKTTLSRKHTQKAHLVSYAFANPFAGIKVISLDDPNDHELPDFLTPLRDFVSCYRDLAQGRAFDPIHPKALYIDDRHNLRLLDILGEHQPTSQALSQLPTKASDVQKAPQVRWTREAVGMDCDTAKESDALFKLPQTLSLGYLGKFRSTREMLESVKDTVLAHKALYEHGELHGDINPNTILISNPREGKQRGFLWDYEPARIYAVPGMEDVNWRYMMSAMPSMRDIVPELVKRVHLNKKSERL